MCSIKMARPIRQLELPLRSWGGRRNGAGRKPGPGRPCVAHRRRPTHDPRRPVHVTLRAAAGIRCLRVDRVFSRVRDAIASASHDGFRVVHFSVQADHVHLLVESDASAGPSRSVQGLAIRVARAVNRALGRRGRVWGDRYHARVLATPREVRNALVYVLNNWRKHVPRARGLDPRSSAAWFQGWSSGTVESSPPSPVARARTWLALVGWRRHGAIDVDERPRSTIRRG